MDVFKRRWVIAWVILGLVIAIGVFAAFKSRGNDKSQFFATKVDTGSIRQVVEATGTINAVTTVQVGSQVSGTIAKLFVDFNSRVKKGQVIAQIDPSLFQGVLLQARADLANAQANLVAAKANFEKAKATAVQAKADFERTQGLTNAGVMSPQQLDLARSNADSSQAAVAAAEAQITQAAAQVKQKQAAVEVAETNLNYTTIHAPIDGTVIARNVDVGQTVAASLQAPTLFTIAQDLTKMQVYANTDESDVGMIRQEQPVSFKVDAFPKDTFSGRVSQVRMNATVVQNVVTYNTVIDFDNPELKLFPGMTAYITIPVASATDILRVPNGALRFKPDLKAEEIRALYQKYGLSGGDTAGGQSPANGAPQGGSGGERRNRGQGGQGENGGAGRGAAGGAAPQTRTPRLDVTVIWKLLPDKSLEPVRIRTGITDHTVTEVSQVLRGSLKDGDEVVTGSMNAASGTRAPGLGGPGPGRR
ncbi:MAG TPA: efflux RND transporter periplasmic adaptor subunit [Terriglobales bacterium]|nr:efflux RND transporter periplasmic adaptor subunit [Terriglobales bacterium]